MSMSCNNYSESQSCFTDDTLGVVITSDFDFSNGYSSFLNATVFQLMSWFYSGSNTKSVKELDKLVNKVILAEDFNSSDLKGFRAARELERLDNHSEEPNFDLPSKDG